MSAAAAEPSRKEKFLEMMKSLEAQKKASQELKMQLALRAPNAFTQW